MDADAMLCSAWRSDVMPDTYLFVDQEAGMDNLPEDLLARFGKAELVTTFKLYPGRHMARADAAEVLRSIRQRGYYLQLPALADALMSAIAERNEKMVR